jgi:1,2-diacylglycerol 3-beta-galactosyltransferase
MGAIESVPLKSAMSGEGASERASLVPPRAGDDTPSADIAADAVAHPPFAACTYEPPTHRDIGSRTPRALSAPPSDRRGSVPERPLRMLVLMSDTGGGHRASADALETAFDQLHEGGADITIVDFWTSVAGFPFHKFPSQYTYLAKRPMLWYAVYLWAKFPPTRWLTETAFSIFCHAKVRRYFEELNPDLIISVHPLVNTLSLSVLDQMRSLYAHPTPPFVTIVTDLGGAHPTWFDKRSDLVYVPSDPLRIVAEETGVHPDKIRMFGLPIRSAFWTEARSRDELRVELGMALDMPAVLLVGGGDGVGGLKVIAAAIAARIAQEVGDSAGQLVVVCGKNKRLLKELQSQSWPIPVILKGFVPNMSEWMSACDVLCSKAGPGTIAEAWTRGLPIIITGFLPGQEEGNVKLVTDAGSGEYHATPEAIADCAAKWVGDPELRGDIAARARELGRPNSTRQIAADVWELSVERTRARDAYIARHGGMNSARRVPNGYLAMMRFYVANGLLRVRRALPTALTGADTDHHLLLRPQ